MNASQTLLQHKPEWANDPVVIIGYFSDDDPGFCGRDWDQIFLHDKQLVDVYGNPVPATTKIQLLLMDGSAYTLREIAEENKPCTVEHLGVEAGKAKMWSRVRQRLIGMIEVLDESA
jgi:hypothetical protein